MIELLFVLVVVGFVLYLVETRIPMDPTIKLVIQFVVVVCAIAFMLRVLGVGGDFPRLR